MINVCKLLQKLLKHSMINFSNTAPSLDAETPPTDTDLISYQTDNFLTLVARIADDYDIMKTINLKKGSSTRGPLY